MLTQDTTLTAKYRREYFLTVYSERGDPQGVGWYDESSFATFSVTSPLPLEGLMGMLGGKYVLDRWSVDSNAVTATASVTMDGPKLVEAEWRIDNTMPYIVIGSAVLTIAIIVILIFLRVARTKGSQKLVQANGAAQTSVFCNRCGAENPSTNELCAECDQELTTQISTCAANTKGRPRECTNCHCVNPPYAQNYCVKCGSRLK